MILISYLTSFSHPQIKEEFFEMLRNGNVKIKPDSPWNKKKKYFFEEDRYGPFLILPLVPWWD